MSSVLSPRKHQCYTRGTWEECYSSGVVSVLMPVSALYFKMYCGSRGCPIVYKSRSRIRVIDYKSESRRMRALCMRITLPHCLSIQSECINEVVLRIHIHNICDVRFELVLQ